MGDFFLPSSGRQFNWCSNRTERPLYHYEERDVSKVNQNELNGSVGLEDFPSDENNRLAVGLKEARQEKSLSPENESLRGEIHADYGIGKTS